MTFVCLESSILNLMFLRHSDRYTVLWPYEISTERTLKRVLFFVVMKIWLLEISVSFL